MIAVVYSGSKSAFWKIANNGKTIAECTMPGINPCFNEPKHILYLLSKNIALINYAEQIKRIYADFKIRPKGEHTNLIYADLLFLICSD